MDIDYKENNQTKQKYCIIQNNNIFKYNHRNLENEKFEIYNSNNMDNKMMSFDNYNLLSMKQNLLADTTNNFTNLNFKEFKNIKNEQDNINFRNEEKINNQMCDSNFLRIKRNYFNLQNPQQIFNFISNNIENNFTFDGLKRINSNSNEFEFDSQFPTRLKKLSIIDDLENNVNLKLNNGKDNNYSKNILNFSNQNLSNISN